MRDHRIVLVDAAKDRNLFHLDVSELLGRANEFLGANALAQSVAAHER